MLIFVPDPLKAKMMRKNGEKMVEHSCLFLTATKIKNVQ